jgi:hypothetical protein
LQALATGSGTCEHLNDVCTLRSYWTTVRPSLVKKHLGAVGASDAKKESPYSAADAAAESPRSQQQMRDVCIAELRIPQATRGWR